jgi:hypothetical protein
MNNVVDRLARAYVHREEEKLAALEEAVSYLNIYIYIYKDSSILYINVQIVYI